MTKTGQRVGEKDGCILVMSYGLGASEFRVSVFD